jgi:hypothetical protein
MWTEGGQVSHLSFGGLRGGSGKGGGGGGGSNPWQSNLTTLTDPVDGQTFTQENNPLLAGTQNGGQPQQFSAAELLNQHITARKAQEQTASDTAAAQKAADAATAETGFQGRRQTSYNDALQSAMQSFTRQGADPNQYLESDIKPALQRQFNSIQDLDPNPSASFPTSLGDTIATGALSGKRTAATQQLNKIFTPQYSQTALPDSSINPFVSQIVNEQFDPLMAGLTNAQKRGTLNQSGYQAALDSLNARKTGATSSVQTLGQGILNTDRANVDSQIGKARTDVNNLGFGDNFDPSSYQANIQSGANTALAGLGGQLRGAVGDTKYADLTDLLNAGGAVQGATQPNATNPAGAGGVPLVDPNANLKRGLGNAGAF